MEFSEQPLKVNIKRDTVKKIVDKLKWNSKRCSTMKVEKKAIREMKIRKK